MKKETPEQKEAYQLMLDSLNELIKEGGCEVKELKTSPFYEVIYKEEKSVWAEYQKADNGYEHFVLKFHKNFLKQGWISEETLTHQFEKDLGYAAAVMRCLNNAIGFKSGRVLASWGIGDSDNEVVFSNIKKPKQ